MWSGMCKTLKPGKRWTKSVNHCYGLETFAGGTLLALFYANGSPHAFLQFIIGPHRPHHIDGEVERIFGSFLLFLCHPCIVNGWSEATNHSAATVGEFEACLSVIHNKA